MEIQGLQKMTLLDYPGKVACTVFLGGCDLRCPFCHNGELVEGETPAALDDGELTAFLKKRQGLLDGVCVTGGEPLLRPELEGLLGRIKELGFPVKLDTNGSHPDRLRRLTEAGLLDYVAMDIKNSPERYGETVGRSGLDLAPFRESVSFLLSGAVDYEFRTTVVRELHDGDTGVSQPGLLPGHRPLAVRGPAVLPPELCRPGYGAPGGAPPLGPGESGGVRHIGAALGGAGGAAGGVIRDHRLRGRSTVNTLPWSGMLSTWIWPPHSSTMRWTMDRPRPRPFSV